MNRTKKKAHKKIEIVLKFTYEIPYDLYMIVGLRTKFDKRIPSKFYLKNFTGKSFYFFSTFRLILKKSYQEGVFDFFYPDPQIDQNLKPTRNLCRQLSYISIWVYMDIVFNIS